MSVGTALYVIAGNPLIVHPRTSVLEATQVNRALLPIVVLTDWGDTITREREGERVTKQSIKPFL